MFYVNFGKSRGRGGLPTHESKNCSNSGTLDKDNSALILSRGVSSVEDSGVPVVKVGPEEEERTMIQMAVVAMILVQCERGTGLQAGPWGRRRGRSRLGRGERDQG